MVRAVKVVPLTDDGYGGSRSFGGGSTGSGKRMMGKVPSLVFDLDDLGEVGQHPQAEPLDEASVAEAAQRLHSLLEPWSEPEYMLLLHVRFAREDAAKLGQALTVPELADTLRRLGYAVKIRMALGGGPGGACLRSLRHSFLTVEVSGPTGCTSVILDPRFRDQFEIAHTTRRYTMVLESVGSEVVCSQDRMNKVVEILCSEMAHAFQETGTPVPPWRQHAAMLSKWQQRRSEEVEVSASLNNGSGMLVPPPHGAPNGGGGGLAKRLTGPSTVAQRLMMLGVTQQQSNPSPISEGLEGVEQSGSWGSVGAGISAGSSASSLHLDWEEGEEEGDARASGAPAVAVPQRTISSGAAAGAGAGAAAPSRGLAILEGIRAAAAALPHRRNNTWAG